MRNALAIASLLAGGLAACDTSGIHPLGRLRDPLVPCTADVTGAATTSTWLRSTETGTEVFLLGRVDPTAAVPLTQPACYGHGVVARDGSTTFEFGSYSLDAQGRGSAVRSVEYVRRHEPGTPILERDGTVRTDLAAPITDTLAIAADGDAIVLTLAGQARRLTAISDVVEALDPSTQAGADDVFRLYNLPLLTSQARLLGFGSGAMTQYVNNTGTFVGMVHNRFTVRVDSLVSPKTRITYFQLEDLTGIVTDGEQITDVNLGGNGKMAGSLAFLMRGRDDVVLRGHVAYDDLIIRNGLAADGTYTLTIEGAPAPLTISYQLANDADLRGVLPVQSP